MPDAFDRCILDLSGIATFDTHKITRYTGISVVEAALLRLTRDFIVANGEHENFRPRLESEREKIIRLGQCEKNTPLVECGRKGKKKNAGWYCEYRVGRKKKMHFLYLRSRLFANGSSRNVEKYAGKRIL